MEEARHNARESGCEMMVGQNVLFGVRPGAALASSA
jgi:hypothetical protein